MTTINKYIEITKTNDKFKPVDDFKFDYILFNYDSFLEEYTIYKRDSLYEFYHITNSSQCYVVEYEILVESYKEYFFYLLDIYKTNKHKLNINFPTNNAAFYYFEYILQVSKEKDKNLLKDLINFNNFDKHMNIEYKYKNLIEGHADIMYEKSSKKQKKDLKEEVINDIGHIVYEMNKMYDISDENHIKLCLKKQFYKLFIVFLLNSYQTVLEDAIYNFNIF